MTVPTRIRGARKSSPVNSERGSNKCVMSVGRTITKKKMGPEKRAPGWQIRCLKCDFTEPWGKYGIRLKASGRTYTFGRCAQCKRIRLHVIEKSAE